MIILHGCAYTTNALIACIRTSDLHADFEDFQSIMLQLRPIQQHITLANRSMQPLRKQLF